ncbi:MAG: vitamin K epoxide reductase family protein [Bacteroidia bacterium]
MKARTSLKVILVIAVAGILFSGYLSYNELTQKACSVCGNPETSHILGLPVCVYGLIMYMAIFVFSLLGLNYKDKTQV